MARTERDRPYSQFNFIVSWQAASDNEGDSLGESDVWGGFQEISGLGLEITVAEYRAGSYATNEPIKITGMVKTPDVTLKRGVMGRGELYKWINAVRDGAQNHLKNVSIKLLGEDRNPDSPAQEWRLLKARPMKWTGPSLNGKGTDLAVEELVLSAESIDLLPDESDKAE
ncbi:MAG: phage tail protein [Chitinivibrionales bacterium]|nr:phage tail protein [Chitinivibrionales bacterium]MBD3357607.1 phage tail protein [Chitinivibrionales bacterium]